MYADEAIPLLKRIISTIESGSKVDRYKQAMTIVKDIIENIDSDEDSAKVLSEWNAFLEGKVLDFIADSTNSASEATRPQRLKPLTS